MTREPSTVRLSFLTARRYLVLLWLTVAPTTFPGLRRYLWRLIVLLLALPVFGLLQASHLLGCVVDEIAFRRYRKLEVRRPVFVLGVPRSGTTFTHRLLARTSNVTTFSTWECLFAPTIAERYFWLGVGRLDRVLGRPLGRLIDVLQRFLAARFDEVHPIRLEAPEEDFFVLLPILCCFLLVLPFPDAKWLWQMAQFDSRVSPEERTAVLGWYRRCLQKHLFVHGADKILLSKNASFAGMAGSLADAFPDSRLVLCERDSVAVIRSQFSALEAGMAAFGIREARSDFRIKLLNTLEYYYSNLARVRRQVDADRRFDLKLWDLSNAPRRVVDSLLTHFDLVATDELESALVEYETRPAKARAARSSAERDLSRWGIQPQDLARFTEWRHDRELRI